MAVAALAFLWDHQVAGQVLLAAAAALEMAVAGSRALLADTAANALALQGVSFDRPLVLPDTRRRCRPAISEAVLSYTLADFPADQWMCIVSIAVQTVGCGAGRWLFVNAHRPLVLLDSWLCG